MSRSLSSRGIAEALPPATIYRDKCRIVGRVRYNLTMTQPDPILPASEAREVRNVRLTFDGDEVLCVEGQTLAAAFLATGRRAWRFTSRRGEPRGVFCGMGICFDCLVEVDGRPNVRACLTPAAEGMRVETQHGAGSWEAPA